MATAAGGTHPTGMHSCLGMRFMSVSKEELFYFSPMGMVDFEDLIVSGLHDYF